jgi:hypothetical protein
MLRISAGLAYLATGRRRAPESWPMDARRACDYIIAQQEGVGEFLNETIAVGRPELELLSDPIRLGRRLI